MIQRKKKTRSTRGKYLEKLKLKFDKGSRWMTGIARVQYHKRQGLWESGIAVDAVDDGALLVSQTLVLGHVFFFSCRQPLVFFHAGDDLFDARDAEVDDIRVAIKVRFIFFVTRALFEAIQQWLDSLEIQERVFPAVDNLLFIVWRYVASEVKNDDLGGTAIGESFHLGYANGFVVGVEKEFFGFGELKLVFNEFFGGVISARVAFSCGVMVEALGGYGFGVCETAAGGFVGEVVELQHVHSPGLS